MRPPHLLFDLSLLDPGGSQGGIKPALMAAMEVLCQSAELKLQLLAKESVWRELPDSTQNSCRWLNAADSTEFWAARSGADLVFSPFGVAPQACPGIPNLVCIADLLHRGYPDSLSDDTIKVREEGFQDAVDGADMLMTFSEYARKILIQTYGIDTSDTAVIGLPALSVPAVPNRNAPHGQSFIYPANTWTHKNHLGLLNAYRDYCDQAGESAWPLILTGHGTEPDGPLAEAVDQRGLQERVTLHGYTSKAKLENLWLQAGALVFPSLHEGFGIPLVEAKAMGLPIVAHDGTSIPEVTGGSALLVDARDPLALAAAMEQITRPEVSKKFVSPKDAADSTVGMDLEFERLLDLLLQTAAGPARLQQKGIFPADGLMEHFSAFALPRDFTQGELTLSTLPLFEPRTLIVYCGPEEQRRMVINGDEAGEFKIPIRASGPTLVLEVTNARRMNDQDPRTHGILIQGLRLTSGDFDWDLLHPQP